MDFYFPGHGKSGDLPPRKGFAEKWHPQLLKECPDIELTLLIGQYAQAYYLHEKVSGKVTERVHHFKDYLPTYFHLFTLPLAIKSGWLKILGLRQRWSQNCKP